MSTPQDTQSSPAKSDLVHCLNCGYDVGLPGRQTCPECGSIVEASTADIVVARHKADERRSRELWWHAAGFGGVFMSYTAALGLWSESAVISLRALVLLALVLGAGFVGGAIGVALSPSWHRRFVVIAWLRSLWWMHVPWLCIGPAVGFLITAVLIDGALDWQGNLVLWTGLAGLPLWIILCFVGLFRSFETCFDTLGRWWPPSSCSARRDLVGACLGIAIFVVLFGAVVVGLIGGSLSVTLAMNLAE